MRLMVAMQMLLPGMPFIYYGDEVGLTGSRDPDSRRGMLWDQTRQDGELLEWYRDLIGARKAFPCLTEGDPKEIRTDDGRGLVIIDRGALVLVFHGREGDVELLAYAGAEDLLTKEPFAGVLHGYQAAVLRLKG